jgi:hypothetical protein
MNRPIPTHDYVAHFDPEQARHRARLKAALERLVDHEPEALVKGGPLWRLWSTETAPIATPPLAEATIGASASRHPNPLEGIPRLQQRDCAQLSQRDRTCFFSSCAMILEALKPGTLPGANGDDAYLAVVQHLAVADGKQQTSGDTTDAGVQLQALALTASPPGWCRPLISR